MKQKKIDLTLKPGEGLGLITFTSGEKDVISKYGRPDKQEEIKDEELKVIYYCYSQAGIEFLFHYKNDNFDHLSVFAPTVVLGQTDLASLVRDQMEPFVENYHQKHEIPYKCELSSADDVNEAYYRFENIGLTVWCSGEFVSEVCVQKTEISN